MSTLALPSESTLSESAQLDIIKEEGISPSEAHVLRSLSDETSETGIVDDGLPMTDWRRALHSLVRRGLATAYRPTELGKTVDHMVRKGSLEIT